MNPKSSSDFIKDELYFIVLGDCLSALKGGEAAPNPLSLNIHH